MLRLGAVTKTAGFRVDLVQVFKKSIEVYQVPQCSFCVLLL